MSRNISRIQALFEKTLPWFILAVLLVFTYARFFKVPYAGFDQSDGLVSLVFVPGAALQPGDQLLQVGPVSMDAFNEDMRQTLFAGARPGDTVQLLVEREGRELRIPWTMPGPAWEEILENLNGLWWYPYIFWLAGTAALVFIRPKGLQWKLLVSFFYLTAVWLAAGAGPSRWHIWESAVLLRAAVFLSLPVYLHFHWVFPRPLAKLPAAVWILLYLGGITLAGLQVFSRLPADLYFLGFILAVVISVILLAAHAIRQPEERRFVGLIALGVALVLVPVALVSLIQLSGFEPKSYIQGAAMLGMPALPGAYFFAVYRMQYQGLERRARRLFTLYFAATVAAVSVFLLIAFVDARSGLEGETLSSGFSALFLALIVGGLSLFPFLGLSAIAESAGAARPQPGVLQLRSNRLIGLYLFFALATIVLAGLVLAAHQVLDFPGKELLTGMGSLILAMIVTALGFERFQRWVDRRLLGIPLPPTHLLETYNDRIITSLEGTKLVGLLRDELLPSLFVRQSALLRIKENGEIEALYSTGVEEAELQNVAKTGALLEGPVGFVSSNGEEATVPEAGWARLAFPLKVEGKPYGLWLLGRRDPDDLYTPGEAAVLHSIANETAIALANTHQAELVKALHRANVERREAELAEMAWMLHDGVLNELAVLNDEVEADQASERYRKAYADLSENVRQIINGLRPAMLAYGLKPGIEQLADDLSDRSGGRVTVQVDLPDSQARYDPQAEMHLFRMVQQACENALRHAQAHTIQVYGHLKPEHVLLVVQDDGVGFPTNGQPELQKLVEQGHFGLVGMYERAGFIGAEVQFHSAPGRGTKVSIAWTPREDLSPKEMWEAGSGDGSFPSGSPEVNTPHRKGAEEKSGAPVSHYE